jgi:hypothetical protein
MTDSSTAQIIFPMSPSERGFAFEELLLSYFRRSQDITVEQSSTWMHSNDGIWYQIDGVLAGNQRQLLEAKFYQKPVGLEQIKPERRLDAARAFDCDELLVVALNGFKADMMAWATTAPLPVKLVAWSDLRGEVLRSLEGTFTVLLDQINLEDKTAKSAIAVNSKLYFNTPLEAISIKSFPEFAIYPDTIECWLRRLPKLGVWQEQFANGQFYYRDDLETVHLQPSRNSLLTLEEAWRIEDAFSGYAARTYNAVRETAQALKQCQGSADLKTIVEVVNSHQPVGKKTGRAGVSDSLRALTLQKLVEVQSGKGKVYNLTPIGWAYMRGEEPDDLIFAQQLNEWLPFRYLRWAVEEHGVPLSERSIMEWFRVQYAPYKPYARCLYNPNKVYGLITWYKQLESILRHLPTPGMPLLK